MQAKQCHHEVQSKVCSPIHVACLVRSRSLRSLLTRWRHAIWPSRVSRSSSGLCTFIHGFLHHLVVPAIMLYVVADYGFKGVVLIVVVGNVVHSCCPVLCCSLPGKHARLVNSMLQGRCRFIHKIIPLILSNRPFFHSHFCHSGNFVDFLGGIHYRLEVYLLVWHDMDFLLQQNLPCSLPGIS